MRVINIFLFLLYTIHATGQEDYRIYHKMINNAERCFFLENKTDSAYQYYDAAFAKFDFVFAKDCYMAAQIAYYNKNERYIAYLRKGFKNGIRPEQLKYSEILSPLLKDTLAFKKKFNDYQELRKAYLKRINVWALKKIIQNVCQDQSEKNIYHNDDVPGHEYEYYRKLYPHINFIETLTRQVGFPGDKLIGIDQVNIMKELGQDSADYMDLYNQIYRDPKYHTEKTQFYSCDDCVAQTKVFPLLIHHVCAYQYFSTYWEKLIISGQVHPRDVAMLYDNIVDLYNPELDPSMIKKITDAFACTYSRPCGCYENNIFVHYKTLGCNRHVVDSMRTALYINTLEVDSAKKNFGDHRMFKTTFGFNGCR